MEAGEGVWGRGGGTCSSLGKSEGRGGRPSLAECTYASPGLAGADKKFKRIKYLLGSQSSSLSLSQLTPGCLAANLLSTWQPEQQPLSLPAGPWLADCLAAGYLAAREAASPSWPLAGWLLSAAPGLAGELNK